MTGDALFETGLAETLAARGDFAFPDGLHLFEFLRDLTNTERLCEGQSVIAIHDIAPATGLGAEREWNREETSLAPCIGPAA